MRIALGSDHAGFPLKAALVESLEGAGHDVDDLGTENATVSVDYPDYGAAVGRAAASGSVDFGIAICGTGIGISMAANKVPGVRAGLAHDVTTATLAKQHNHANVLCFGARVIGSQTAIDSLEAFMAAEELDGRHVRRIDELTALDEAGRQSEEQA
jgi:ribose 5-phosphate isomerase B